MINTIKPDTSGFVWLHRLIDLLTPTLTLSCILFVSNFDHIQSYLLIGIISGLTFVTVSQQVGIYQNWRGRHIYSSIKLIFLSWLWTWMALIAVAYLYKNEINLSNNILVVWAIVTPLALIGYRVFLRTVLARLRSKGFNRKRIAIIGAGKVGQHLAEVFQKNSWLGYELTAFFDDDPVKLNTSIDNIEVKGSCSVIAESTKKNKYDEIYICLPLRAENKIKEILESLTDTTAIVKFVPDLFSFDLMHAKSSQIGGIAVFSVYDSPLSSLFNRTIKRIEDLILATSILTIIFPLLILVAIGVKRSSPGPIIFKQKRYGLRGEEILVYKFRSMTTQDNGNTVKQATRGDARITPFGAFIRKTSLDELPQFINVLQGKMSIVGPRPHAVAHNEQYRKLVPKYMQRHIAKPGITGWAQINGWRGETDTLDKMEKRIEFDLHYINHWSLWLDLKIVFLTIFKGFINKNAY